MDEALADAGTDGLTKIFAQIPIAAAMQLRIANYRNRRLVLVAPFEPNRNHAGIAFGGAIECLATLAGWGLLWLQLARPDADIVIRRAETRFTAPLTGELHATATSPDAKTWRDFTATLERRRRARIDVHATVGDAQNIQGAGFRGSYAVRLSGGAGTGPRG